MNLPHLEPLWGVALQALDRARSGTEYIIGNGLVGSITTGLTISLTDGDIVSKGTRLSISSGSITMDTAHASLYRRDIVYVNSLGVISKLAGAPALQADAYPPNIPVGGVLILVVHIAPNQTVLSSADLIDVAQPLAKGPTMVEAAILGNAILGQAFLAPTSTAYAKSILRTFPDKVYVGSWIVSDIEVTAGSHITAWAEEDEAEMEPMDVYAENIQNGAFTLMAVAREGPVTGQYRFSYIVGGS